VAVKIVRAVRDYTTCEIWKKRGSRNGYEVIFAVTNTKYYLLYVVTGLLSGVVPQVGLSSQKEPLVIPRACERSGIGAENGAELAEN